MGLFIGAVSFGAAVTMRHEISEDAIILSIVITALEYAPYGGVSSGKLALNALSLTVLNPPEDQQKCIFDLDEVEREWRAAKTEVAVALISQWENYAGNARRWHGLLLRKFDHSDPNVGSYERVGVYLGPLTPLRKGQGSRSPGPIDSLGDEWVRREFCVI